MADDYDEYSDPAEQQTEARGLRKQLEEALAKAKDAETLRSENAQLKRDGVIRDAGLTLSDVQRKALAGVHDGTWDAETVKKTAEALGFITTPPVADDPSLAQHEQLANAHAGTDVPAASRDADLDIALSKASTEEEFLALYRTSGRPLAL